MKRPLIVGVITLAVLVAAIGVVYAFGAPQQALPPESPAAVADPAALSAGQAPSAPEVDSGAGGGASMADVPVPPPGTEAPAADPNAPLAIQIPGCVCHSKDPKVVKQHAGYRMNQCAGCHAGKTPTGR